MLLVHFWTPTAEDDVEDADHKKRLAVRHFRFEVAAPSSGVRPPPCDCALGPPPPRAALLTFPSALAFDSKITFRHRSLLGGSASSNNSTPMSPLHSDLELGLQRANIWTLPSFDR